MPQFDPSSFPSQLFWLFVSFSVLYWVIARFAIPRIGGILEQRERVVQDDLDRAESLKSEAEQALADYEAAIAHAREQARALMNKVQNEAKAAAEARNKDVGSEMTAQITEAEKRIAAARDSALADLASVAAEAAQDAATRLAGLDVSTDEAEAAVDAVKAGNA